ncbi:hypothetical protein BN3456_02270 [Clostridium sp. C105KSO13]|nr:hypothetical protein BN3456_02270 [Clostridium sp. C105KSO13]
MEDMFGAISILILGAGVYIIYAYIKMKQTGHINEVLLLGKGFTEQMCKDKKAFNQKAIPAVLILGIVTIFYGAVDAVHYFLAPITVLDLIAMAAFVVVLVWYMVYTTKLKKQYF